MNPNAKPPFAEGDPFGCRIDLEEALAQPGLEGFEHAGALGADHAMAAYQVAVALGRCRLFDVDVGDLDGTLPPAMALAAARQLTQQLIDWSAAANRLGTEFDDAADPLEAEDCCIELLEARMEAWAAYLAIDEAEVDASENGSPEAAALIAAQDEAVKGIRQFDEKLWQQRELLTVAADTHLLDNWRMWLGSEFRELLPWWLNGTLESIATEAWRQMSADFPGLEAWSRLARLCQIQADDPQALVQSKPWLEFEPHYAMAAASENPPSRPKEYEFESPDGKWKAVLDVPERVEESEELIVIFSDKSDSEAHELEGLPVLLDGVYGEITAPAVARFAAIVFQEAHLSPLPELCVAGVLWKLVRQPGG